ncbi:MAG TPA: hypothetical protein VIM08_02435 [Arthrobacter sp.]|jgi:hypothetical protein
MTEHESQSTPRPRAADAPVTPAQPDRPESKDTTESNGTSQANDTPESRGVRSRLTEAQRAMLASKSRGGDAGLTSVGKSHKPTHASGKQGPAEKKVRW